MGIVEVNPADIDFSALDSPTGCKRGRIVLAESDIDHADIEPGTWVVDGIWDTVAKAEDNGKEYLLTRTITYKTCSGWVDEKYYGNGRLARQSFCYEDGCTRKRLVWTEYGTLLSLEDHIPPEEISDAVKRDGQAVIRREYFPSGRVQSELVAVELDYYCEGDPQLFFVSVGYDENGRVTARSHAKVA